MTPSVSSPYGWRLHPTLGTWKFHNGTDFRMPVGTPILAAASGRVSKVYVNEATNGTGVTLTHGNGWGSSYLHLSRLDVAPGQVVQKGQQLGLSGGAPGTWGAGRSTGPHLHFMITYQGQALDPLPLLWS